MIGRLVHWNARGFGFIETKEVERQIFCHVSQIDGGNKPRDWQPEKNAEVMFDVTVDRGRPVAHNVIFTGD